MRKMIQNYPKYCICFKNLSAVKQVFLCYSYKMISSDNFKKYLFNSITYIDGNMDDKIKYFQEYINEFWVSICICKDGSKNNLFKDFHFQGIMMNQSDVLKKDFSFETVLTDNLAKMDKLIIIEKMTSELINSEYMRDIFNNNKELNITIIILSFNPLKDKNLLNLVDKIIFAKKDDIKNIYFRCFLTYPIYDVFQRKMTELKNNQYMIYLKRSDNYLICENRFIMLDYENYHTNYEDMNMGNNDCGVEEIILTIVI